MLLQGALKAQGLAVDPHTGVVQKQQTVTAPVSVTRATTEPAAKVHGAQGVQHNRTVSGSAQSHAQSQ